MFTPRERAFLEPVASLGYCNPFLPERPALEKAALGREFSVEERIWSRSVTDLAATRANVARIHARLQSALGRVRERLTATSDLNSEDAVLYEECVHQLLYQRYYPDFISTTRKAPFFRKFLEDWKFYFELPGKRFETATQPDHLFACFWQLQRAFHLIFDDIIGSSLVAARLRANVWQSVFTHDMRRYRRALYLRMGDFPTLITGPSGSGKELVARALAGSRYVPFDPARLEFRDSPEQFFPINLAVLSPTLIESELFGHRRGAFTGAIADRKGWLQACPPLGSVFLDELGELDLSIQVKLLRVIETRRFSAVGDTALCQFQGKLLAATNRDLSMEIEAGRFRADLYYRLCADQVRTPSLEEQIRESPEVLREILTFMVRRIAGEDYDRALVEVERWVMENLGVEYPWPGNYREVEQCVRNLIIRGSYQPLHARNISADGSLTDLLFHGTWTAEQLLDTYAAAIYRRTGSYEATARHLHLDRRTVKAKVESYLRQASGWKSKAGKRERQ